MKIFYSWQSDLPNKTNRGFIEDALRRAVKDVQSNSHLEIEPVIDRDTLGVPGSPDIVDTILRKIDDSSVFVGDISIVVRPEKGRASPNPNVLIELGYALKALGLERLILVFNRAFGEVGELPFDLTKKRVMLYDLKPESSPGEQRKILAKQLEAALGELAEHIATSEREQARRPAAQRETILKKVISHAPIEDDDSSGWMRLFAQPALENSETQSIAVKATTDWAQLVEEAQKSGWLGEEYRPTFGLPHVRPTVAGWTLYMGAHPLRQNAKRRSKEILDLRIGEDALIELHCGRAGDFIESGKFVVLEAIVAGLTAQFIAFAGGLYKRGRYVDEVDIGISISGIRGAEPYTTTRLKGIWLDSPGFPDDSYERTSRVSALTLSDNPKEVARSLLRGFFRGLTHDRYDPFEDAES